MDSSVSTKDEIWFLRVCHHVSNAVFFCLESLQAFPFYFRWLSSTIEWFVYIYTGCPRRNGQNFGRVFLMLNYTDITQNTYIQSWTVTEIMAWEKCGHLAFPRTVRLQLSRIDLDSAIKAVISVTARAPPNAIRQYFITVRYSCAM